MIRTEAIESLRRMIPINSTVYTVLTHIASSGMMRHIKVLIVGEGKIRDISWCVARTLDWKQADNGGVKVGGCGLSSCL